MQSETGNTIDDDDDDYDDVDIDDFELVEKEEKMKTVRFSGSKGQVRKEDTLQQTPMDNLVTFNNAGYIDDEADNVDDDDDSDDGGDDYGEKDEDDDNGDDFKGRFEYNEVENSTIRLDKSKLNGDIAQVHGFEMVEQINSKHTDKNISQKPHIASANKSVAFNNAGYIDDKVVDYFKEEKDITVVRLKRDEQNMDRENRLIFSDNDKEMRIDKHSDVTRKSAGKRSVTFKNEADSKDSNQKPKNILVSLNTDNGLPIDDEIKFSKAVTSEEIEEQIEEEESENEQELQKSTILSTELTSLIGRLRSSGKVEKATLIDFHGNILIRSHGLEIKSEEAVSILRVIKSPYKSPVRFRIGREDFTCFKNSSTSFIGKSDNDFLCAISCSDFIVVGISDPNSPGSCIYEVTKFVKRCNRNSIVNKNGYETVSA